MRTIKNIAEKILNEALLQGAKESEVFSSDSKNTMIKIHKQEIESISQTSDSGIGVRIFIDNKVGFFSTSDLQETQLSKLVTKIIGATKKLVQDEYQGLPETFAEQSNTDLKIFDETLEKISIADKIKYIKSVEKDALNYDDRILTDFIIYSESIANNQIINSKGIDLSYKETGCAGSILGLTKQQDKGSSGEGFIVRRYFNEILNEKIGKEAAYKAITALEGEPIPTTKTTLIFTPEVAAEFFSYIASALSAEAVLKGRSIFINKLGESIASQNINLIDDGTLLGLIGTIPFDGEGVTKQRIDLVVNGKLKNFFHNSYTARQSKKTSTGNAVRSSYKSMPSIGTSNFYLKSGNNSKEEIISDIKNGVLIFATTNVGGINPITGNYSTAASGIRIEDGKLTKPVDQILIAGNLLTMLKNISQIANDFKWISNIGTPSIRIDEMIVSGE